MDAIYYLSEIHFASLFFLGVASSVAFAGLCIVRLFWKPTVVHHDFVSFFRAKRKRIGGFRRVIYQFYRALPYLILVLLIIASGNPVHEKKETVSEKKTPYVIILDASGSTEAAKAFESGLVMSFNETVLNAFRLALLRFVENEKGRAEFFLMFYSNIPYAARYFIGGEEAEIQIVKFLKDLPYEIRKRNDSSRRFYFKGTQTAFAVESAARYRASVPEVYSQSVFVILTDFEDPNVFQTAQAVESLIESGLKRKIYFVTLSGSGGGASLGSFERALKYPEQVRIYKAESGADLDAAFRAIAEAEKPYAEISKETFRSRSLQPFILYVAFAGMLALVLLLETQFRRIP